jgi:hypothetical protein
MVGGDDMPLTKKGKKIKRKMKKTYGKEKAERVFYASKNKGKIKGVDKAKKKRKKRRTRNA